MYHKNIKKFQYFYNFKISDISEAEKFISYLNKDGIIVSPDWYGWECLGLIPDFKVIESPKT